MMLIALVMETLVVLSDDENNLSVPDDSGVGAVMVMVY